MVRPHRAYAVLVCHPEIRVIHQAIPCRPCGPESRPDKAKRGAAFSLVELVIVVVIIGIIAAVAVPRLGSGSQEAGESALLGSLTALRNAIDRYSAEHVGVFPGAIADGLGGAASTELAFTNQLTLSSSAQGACSPTPAAGFAFGPYLRKVPPVPVGPNAGEATVAIDSTNSPPLVTGGSEAWVYNPTTGEILANTDASNIDGTRTYDEY